MPSASPSQPSTKHDTSLFRAWWQASRPPFYIATLIPVILGFIVASKDIHHWDYAGLGGIMLICFLLHLSANLGNDLFDHWQGIDAGPNIGGSRVIQEGKISTKTLSIVLTVIYILTLCFSAIGVAYFGKPKLWYVTFFAIFSTLFYVAPPIKYGHRALGELFVFCNMGLAMTTGTYYAFTGQLPAKIIILSLPVGLMVAGILYYQSLPEIKTDKAVGKNTLANTLGPVWAIVTFQAWWPFIWGLMCLCWLLGYSSPVVLAGAAASAPLYLKTCRILRTHKGDWLELDTHGHLVRKMYALCGLGLVVGVLTM